MGFLSPIYRKISSESFTFEENTLLKQILERKYGLVSNIRFKETIEQTLPYLRLPSDSSLKLIEIVKKFATKDMLYKVDEQEYLIHVDKFFDKDAIKRDFIMRHNLVVS